MVQAVAILDACVLYPAQVRSLLMYLAVGDVFSARWTDAIHNEWMRSVAADYPNISRSDVERIRDLMNANVRGCLVTGYEDLVAGLTLPDPNDRHVLAAAITVGADVIVTFNLSDFPPAALSEYDVIAQHPDEFVTSLFEQIPDAVCTAVGRHRNSLKHPPKSADEYLAMLEKCGLPKTVAYLGQFMNRI